MARWKQIALVVVLGEVLWFVVAALATPLSFGEMVLVGVGLALVTLLRIWLRAGARDLGTKMRERRLARKAEHDAL